MKIVRVLGGLGNQMFQYAFYLALNKRFKNVKLDVSAFENYGLHNGLELENVFNLTLNKASEFCIKLYDPACRTWGYRKLRRILQLKGAYYEEKEEFSFDQDIFSDPSSYLFWGYWQNENYFKDIECEIKKVFSFNHVLDKQNQDLLKKIAQIESVSIHIRRGDYIGHDLLGGICTPVYYQNAINLIKQKVSNPVFFIFSNEIDWCKDNLDIADATYIYGNTGHESYKDMLLMSACKHNIIANSSFSWWGAWLNANAKKIIIAPKKWTNNSKQTDYGICPNNWIKI